MKVIWDETIAVDFSIWENESFIFIQKKVVVFFSSK